MYDLVGGVKHYEDTARKLIRDLVNGSENPWHQDRDKHTLAYAIHAKNRYQAVKLAKEAYNRRLLPDMVSNKKVSMRDLERVCRYR